MTASLKIGRNWSWTFSLASRYRIIVTFYPDHSMQLKIKQIGKRLWYKPHTDSPDYEVILAALSAVTGERFTDFTHYCFASSKFSEVDWVRMFHIPGDTMLFCLVCEENAASIYSIPRNYLDAHDSLSPMDLFREALGLRADNGQYERFVVQLDEVSAGEFRMDVDGSDFDEFEISASAEFGMDEDFDDEDFNDEDDEDDDPYLMGLPGYSGDDPSELGSASHDFHPEIHTFSGLPPGLAEILETAKKVEFLPEDDDLRISGDPCTHNEGVRAYQAVENTVTRALESAFNQHNLPAEQMLDLIMKGLLTTPENYASFLSAFEEYGVKWPGKPLGPHDGMFPSIN